MYHHGEAVVPYGQHGGVRGIEELAGPAGRAKDRPNSTVKSLLEHNADPSEAEIKHALSGNLCRCTGYQQMYSAIRAAIKAEQAGMKAVAG